MSNTRNTESPARLQLAKRAVMHNLLLYMPQNLGCLQRFHYPRLLYTFLKASRFFILEIIPPREQFMAFFREEDKKAPGRLLLSPSPGEQRDTVF